MKRVVLILIGLLLFILDNTILPSFAIKGAWGSLLFTFAICYSLITGPWEAIFVGVYSGILQDVFFGNVFGVNSLINLILCLLAALVGKNIFKNRKTIPIMTVLGATAIKFLVMYIVLFFMKMDVYFENMIVMTAMNTVFAFIFYRKIYNFTEKSFMKNPWKFN